HPQLPSEGARRREHPSGWTRIVRALRGEALLGPKPHAVEHVLVARRRKHFLDTKKIVARWWMLVPKGELFAQAIRNRLGADVVAPERGIGSLRQHVVHLQKVDHSFPTISELVIE